MRSINRSKKHNNLINILTTKDPKTGVQAFPTIKALQCYAAVIGFDQGRRDPLNVTLELVVIHGDNCQ